VAALLDGARLVDRLPPTLLLLGVVPESIELEVGLSPAVAASIPELAVLVVEDAARLGYAFVPGESDAPELDRERSAFHVARLAGV
jgi:hypothetical protein